MTPSRDTAVGFARVVRATRHSVHGLQAAFHGERAFRQELCLAVVMLPAAFWLGRNWLEMALLIGSVLLVLIVELLNSSVEAAVDRISLDLHELSKRAKDLASAAVFLSVLLCGGLWMTALWLRFAP